MQKSKILIINIGNLAEEVAKNIVLANIKSLVICDHAKVTKEDTMRQFLIHEGTEGQSVPKSIFAARLLSILNFGLYHLESRSGQEIVAKAKSKM